MYLFNRSMPIQHTEVLKNRQKRPNIGTRPVIKEKEYCTFNFLGPLTFNHE